MAYAPLNVQHLQMFDNGQPLPEEQIVFLTVGLNSLSVPSQNFLLFSSNTLYIIHIIPVASLSKIIISLKDPI